MKVTTTQKEKIFNDLEKQKSDNLTLKELLVEEQDKLKEFTDKAGQILIRMGEDYVSAMDLIQTYQGANGNIRPSEACRQYQKNLQNSKNIKVTVRQSKSPMRPMRLDNSSSDMNKSCEKSISPFSKNFSSIKRRR